jgi:hypothetical protein
MSLERQEIEAPTARQGMSFWLFLADTNPDPVTVTIDSVTL